MRSLLVVGGLSLLLAACGSSKVVDGQSAVGAGGLTGGNGLGGGSGGNTTGSGGMGTGGFATSGGGSSTSTCLLRTPTGGASGGDLGAQTFSFRVGVAYPVAGTSAASADLDGNGSVDLAVAVDDGNVGSVSVVRNDGQGVFGAATNYPLSGVPDTVVAADLNGDGKIDLAVTTNVRGLGTRWGDGSVSVLLNHGDGTFAPAVDYPAGKGATRLVAGDLDRDGDSDVAVLGVGGSQESTVAVLFNDGAGVFGNAVVNPTGSASPVLGDLAFLVDLNGDSFPDKVVPRQGDVQRGGVDVLINDGAGAFDGAGSFRCDGFYYLGCCPFSAVSSVMPGDLDGNGTIDLFATVGSGGALVVMLNNGDGSFAAPIALSIGTKLLVTLLAVTDLNGDHKLDFVLSVGETHQMTVFINASP